ncbi:MAG TPA: methyltransferase domain-containing protein [Holophagaceae bacterium]|nr:methyltransferase domain-containing protein [Holophagaceae bacterium]
MEIQKTHEDEQAALWNGPAGRGWVEAQAVLDTMFQPFEDLLLDAVPAGSGARVLDVGCGTGGTTLAFARRAGGGGCLGVDISEPMIAAARARAAQAGAPVDFLVADAGAHAFEPANFDVILSRFGVMFFGDPAGAFAHLRRAARDGAGLRFAAWRGAAENPFMTAAERAAAPLLPELPPRLPNAPGQFAFADPQRIHGILAASGWGGIDIRPLDVACAFPEAELPRYLTWVGPVGRFLQEADAPTRARILDTLRGAFAPFMQGGEVRFTAACWQVDARAV